ncbi:MAG TPA: type II secretion system protein [Verrucomicrobiae bacterium]|jgi:prepilin-type N-terminal cleavage/methylation domain-containing protein
MPSAGLNCHTAARRGRRDGFSLIEIVIVIGLMSILIVAGLSTITLLDRSARRQAVHTTAMELAQGKIEELQSTAYNPPTAPFMASTTIQTTNVVLSLNKTGTSNAITGTMAAVISPVAQGHLVTVTVTSTNYNQPMTVQLQTVVNKSSGGQP